MPRREGAARRDDRGPAITGSNQPAPHISRIATDEPDKHYTWIRDRCTDHKRLLRARAQGFNFFTEFAALDHLTFARTRYAASTVEIDCPATPYILAARLHSGRYLMRWDGGEVRLAGPATMLFPPSPIVHLHDCSDSSCVSMRLDGLLRVAEESTGLDRAQVRFTGLLPISPAADRHWLATAAYVQSGIYSRAFDHPLLRVAAERMVAASMLATFPNTTMTTELRTPRDPATPAVVRRAIAFIDAHAGEPVTLTDIAEAVGVVPRTLQYAFRRHHDTTPMAYLRRVRLARAHEDLTQAQPGDGMTVAQAAARWGFGRPHRFADAYRQAYGRPPGQTLRS